MTVPTYLKCKQCGMCFVADAMRERCGLCEFVFNVNHRLNLG